MDNQESPVQETVESPLTATDNANNPEDFLLQYATEVLADEKSSDEAPAEQEEVPQVSEEADIQEENPDPVGDDDETIEAQDEDDETEELTEDESTDEEPTEVLDYDEIKDLGIPIKRDGEVTYMTLAQIQSEFGQLGAASQKSRKATEQLESLEADRALLTEEQSAFKAQQQAAALTPELTEKAGRLQVLNSQYTQAAANGDASKALQIENAIKRESEEFGNLQQQHQAAVEEARGQHIQAQVRILEDKGLGDVLNDESHSSKFADYVESNLSESAQFAVNLDATLVEALEKARLYDESKQAAKKVKRTTRKVGKTLKAGDNKVTAASQKAQAASAKQARRQSGNFSQEEAEAGIDELARRIVGVE